MNILMLIKIYFVVTLLTAILFVLTAFSGVFQDTIQSNRQPPLHHVVTALSSDWLMAALSNELPSTFVREQHFSLERTVRFLFEWSTHLNPFEPKSLLAAGVPGMERQQAVLLHGAVNDTTIDAPFDPTPSKKAITVQKSQEETTSQFPLTTRSGQVQASKKKVLIYHSHNRESWIPELKHRNITNPDLAFDERVNITLLGERLALLLEQKGVGAHSMSTDYPSSIATFKYTKSYSYSLKTVQEAIARNGEYDFYFDIHRDAQPRKKTTFVHKGQAYAQVYFIVGGKNPNWRKNYEFAKAIHDALQERMPGLSKSIYAKRSHGNGEYNQSVSQNSALIEIGGPYNTLAESYRTIAVLADVIAEQYYDAKEVGGGQ